MPYILSLVTFLPLLGAAAIFAARLGSKTQEGAAPAARWIALITTLVVLAVSVVLVAGFNPSNPGYQFVEMVPWFAGASYHLGVDGPWPATWSADGERVRFDDGEGRVEVQLDAQGRIDQIRGDLA